MENNKSTCGQSLDQMNEYHGKDFMESSNFKNKHTSLAGVFVLPFAISTRNHQKPHLAYGSPTQENMEIDPGTSNTKEGVCENKLDK